MKPINAEKFMKKFGTAKLKFRNTYKGTKRYKVVGDPDSIIEFVSESMFSTFTADMSIPLICHYIKSPIFVFDNDNEDFLVYRVTVERR